MKASFLAACLALAAPNSWAATCSVQKDLKAVSDSMMQCEEEIGSSAQDLDNADESKKKAAAQKIAAAVHTLDEQEKFLNQQPASPDPGDVIKNNKLQIADIRDIHKEDLSRAAHMSQASGGSGSPASGQGGAPSGQKPPPGESPGGTPSSGSPDNPSGDDGSAGSPGPSGVGIGDARSGGSISRGPGAPISVAHENIGQDGAHALGDASGVGAQLNSQNRSPENLGGAGPQGKAMGQLGGFLSAAKEPGYNIANPKTANDLMLASMTGFRGSFEKLGMRVAGGRILGPDGKPASESNLARLRAQIHSDPAALMRRPDVFSVISRERFSELKEDFVNRSDVRDTAFKHIGMTDGRRDFARTESCQKLSGDCNPYTTLMSYKKGDDVVPEDLRAISYALHGESEDDAREGAEPAKLAETKSLYGKINGVIRGFREFLQGDNSGATAAPEPGAVAAGTAGLAGGLSGGTASEIATGAAPRREASAAAPPVMVSAAETKTGTGKSSLEIALLLAAAGAVAFKLKRAPSDDPPE